ncbi:MAG: DUF1566 domain-containing protein [Chloroflexi bacterium]|nr:MAG: DUF1566 domain-containing protein [Chloroflexota bacterium]
MFKKINIFLLLSMLIVLVAACTGQPVAVSSASADTSGANPTEKTAGESLSAIAVSNTMTEPETSSDVSFPLTETGQTACYDTDGTEIDCPAAGEALYGQDAQYTGNAMSYTDHGDGTVTDNVTGLTWQKTPPQQDFTWQDAADYCQSLTLAGYDDWRLPNVKELFSISDFSSGWPYLDTRYFHLVNEDNITKDEQYWTSTRYVGVTAEGGANAAFGVNHATGHIKAYPAQPPDQAEGMRSQPPTGQPEQGAPPRSPAGRTEQGAPPQPPSGQVDVQGPPPGGGGLGSPFGKYVRCVRGTEYGNNNFVDNGDGTITDNATGLMWAQADSGVGMTWEEALAWVQQKNAENYLGYSDWRLPNVKELQSIVDYTQAPGASDPANEGPAIDPLFSISSITNEAGDADYPYFWTSTSARFQACGDYYYAWYVAFGRAVDPAGVDSHGAGAVRFDAKIEGGPAGEGGERYTNYVRLVRGGDVTETPNGNPTGETCDAPNVMSPDGPNGGPRGQRPPGGQPPQLDLSAAAEKLGVTEADLQAALGDLRQGPPNFAAAAETLGVTEAELMDALGVSPSGPPPGGQPPAGGPPPAARP